MAINWVLPVRAVQFVLSVVVLGLMAYGTSFSLFLFPPPYIHLTFLLSIIMVVNTLAPILPQ
jgi:uncharacterized membrane protein